ncbi:hypothetical protein PMZ80_008431 [Knufia obscura]|uniref:Uncharacterized protein n=1 Tax=Knufia obscura TaxID=1635080 RepID=A0ABR0RFZ0_9EURO|nr:hypothetical protein PMZ80_008431 [Knufia obscura]
MPTCRSIQKQVARNGEPEQQFKRVLCNNILAGTPCEWGHEKEGARTLMLFMYEEHQAQAKREGARDRVLRRLSARNQLQNYWRPIPTNPRCLKDPYIYPDGTVTAWTHHQFPVTLMYIKDAAFLSDLADKQRRREYEERLAHQQQLEQERPDRQLEHNRRITQELLERARQALMARHYSSGASHPSNSEDHHDLAAVDHDSSTSWSSIVPCLSPSVISASFEWTPSQDPTTFEECLSRAPVPFRGRSASFMGQRPVMLAKLTRRRTTSAVPSFQNQCPPEF